MGPIRFGALPSLTHEGPWCRGMQSRPDISWSSGVTAVVQWASALGTMANVIPKRRDANHCGRSEHDTAHISEGLRRIPHRSPLSSEDSRGLTMIQICLMRPIPSDAFPGFSAHPSQRVASHRPVAPSLAPRQGQTLSKIDYVSMPIAGALPHRRRSSFPDRTPQPQTAGKIHRDLAGIHPQEVHDFTRGTNPRNRIS
jgi:hypothetical protein